MDHIGECSRSISLLSRSRYVYRLYIGTWKTNIVMLSGKQMIKQGKGGKIVGAASTAAHRPVCIVINILNAFYLT